LKIHAWTYSAVFFRQGIEDWHYWLWLCWIAVGSTFFRDRPLRIGFWHRSGESGKAESRRIIYQAHPIRANRKTRKGSSFFCHYRLRSIARYGRRVDLRADAA